MITIYAGGAIHNVDIRKDFKPVYIRSLKFATAMNGKVQVSDRGDDADKYECTFTVIGDTADIETLAENIYKDVDQLLILTNGIKLFGEGLDHSGSFYVNLVSGVIDYPIRDLLTSTLTLKVRVVSAVTYDTSIPATLPDLHYQHPIKRKITSQKSYFDSIAFGDYGAIYRGAGSAPTKVEEVTVSLDMTSEQFGQLHRFVAVTRGDSFTLDTSVCLELFLNSTSTSVKITKFSYSPNDAKNWRASITLVNNV